MRTVLLGALALTLVLALVDSPPAGALRRVSAIPARDSLPTLLTGWYGRYVVRPTSIYYTGDGSGTVGVLRRAGGLREPGRGFLRWRSWAQRRADGIATLWLKLGTPTATSPWTRFAASVTLGRVRDGHFTRMTLRYRLGGNPVADVRCVPDRVRVFEWRLPEHGRC